MGWTRTFKSCLKIILCDSTQQINTAAGTFCCRKVTVATPLPCVSERFWGCPRAWVSPWPVLLASGTACDVKDCYGSLLWLLCNLRLTLLSSPLVSKAAEEQQKGMKRQFPPGCLGESLFSGAQFLPRWITKYSFIRWFKCVY